MNFKPAFALVLLFVTIVTFYGAKSLAIYKTKRKVLGVVSAILALLPLVIFKYYNFLNENIGSLLNTIGLQFSLPGLNWAVPVGISFFTFQAVGYFFDVYYKRVKAEQSLLDYILFVSFFPQILSGPISKTSELLPQLKTFKPFHYAQCVSGLRWLLWGMFLKLVIADRMDMYVNEIFKNYAHYSGTLCLIGSVFYSFQIYADFAGYSYMAMGIAKTLGIDLINNFKQPYLAISITDFWRRWHISLSRWLKENVYIPLGGSRCSKARNYFNIFVTFLVSGIWHGANWTFIVWGMIHGIVQIIEKFFHLQSYAGKSIAMKVFKVAVTFILVDFAWIFFRMPDLSSAIGFIRQIFTHFGESFSFMDYKLSVFLVFIILKDLVDEFKPSLLYFNSVCLRYSVYSFLVILILLTGVLSSGQFIYVSF